jgi:hypothetical protein
MTDSEDQCERRYAAIAAQLTMLPGVTQSMKRGFAQYGLKVEDKLFACLWRRDSLILKLPRNRVDWLADSGDGRRFDPGHGRPMKEWIVVNADAAVDWLDLAREAMDFVRKVAAKA